MRCLLMIFSGSGSGLGFLRPVVAVALLGLLAAGGCATPPSADDPEAVQHFEEINDPLEPLNRQVFWFNEVLDNLLLRPLAFAYREGVPPPLRTSVRSFLDNLKSPLTLLNDVLQLNADRAGETLLRFSMNSTIGFFGFADVAAEIGYPGHHEDFGQTLASWGLESGPYVVLPVLGPSNLRDAGGQVVDILVDPTGFETTELFRLGAGLVSAVDRRAQYLDELDDLRESSLDFYAAARSLHRQHRARQLENHERSHPVKPSPLAPVVKERIR